MDGMRGRRRERGVFHACEVWHMVGAGHSSSRLLVEVSKREREILAESFFSLFHLASGGDLEVSLCQRSKKHVLVSV